MGCVNLSFGVGVCIGLMLILTARSCFGLTDPLDVMAINSLYVSLGYPPLLGWLLVGGDPCGDNWEGVRCVFSNVTELRLSGLNLGGELGYSLGDFGSILAIDLSNNHIGGTIPSLLPLTIRNFIPDTFSLSSQLMDLSLKNNFLSGGIPDAFQQLTGLMNLDLSRNNLSGPLPPSLENLSSLTTLHLQNNQLSGTLDVLQDLPLQDLNIENNAFSGPIPPKLLSIPIFRKDGNPFNTTVIPSAPTAAPPRAAAPYSAKAPGLPTNGPAIPDILSSTEDGKFFTAKRVTWISVLGALILVACMLCLCMLRCLKGRQGKKNSERHDLGAYKASREKPNYETSVQQNDQMEKVPRETVVKPPDRYAVDNERKVVVPKLQSRQELDVKKASAVSIPKKDHDIDMSSMDLDFLPPPPPPPFFLSEEVNAKPTVPVEVTTSRHRSKGLNTSSVEVFTVAWLQQHTNSFSPENFIGEGMLGSVYRAELPGGKLLAIKKLDAKVSRQQSDEDFLELVSSISKIRHANIVELVGYCAEHGQQLLVYEYCQNGTLHDALHVDNEIHKRLSWKTRIQVALGAARALEYMHEICQPSIVHRNFKSANLLLDNKLEVRVSDCGLAPLLSSDSASKLSGRLLIAYGYGAPEFDSGSYTYQSDVYSFGVVMLELLTGRKSYDRSLPRGEQFLVRWAIPQLHDIDALARMVDPSLKGAYPIRSLSRFADIISSCVQREPEFRPSMSEIVQELLQMI
ncbi:protein STRUBBELIG-RECEPTOR FAMILY 3-like isoform X2 [Juglans microcarpa x Juglans regia]|uniref:protein STRUBBELIG-RECEPTOR FAMILY 3-like isoform X2 n=1 Tax=Juglans microcarpa x Juglans regia TaxID=2249226 RepID=UPI001B7F66AF|nr:protein STRUBBELIG-RECEPTOR FAMILY 3-like isoform X2 [Juglans microcarpa x Juglans regia]